MQNHDSKRAGLAIPCGAVAALMGDVAVMIVRQVLS